MLLDDNEIKLKPFNYICVSNLSFLKIVIFTNNDQGYLKLVSTIFYQFFIFSPDDSPSKTEKCFLFHLKNSFLSRDIQFFVIFSLPFHAFQIQKNKWKWNNL